jgi:hypothetical protein
MTVASSPAVTDRSDVGSMLRGGALMGGLTIAGVVAFALLSRSLAGTTETVVQSVLVLVGGVVFSYVPAVGTRPRTVDGIAWASLVGLLGALVFSVVDTAVLRPVHLYNWRWDAIGGGSGYWYIPVWWMGSAFLAWLGAWTVATGARGGREPNPLLTGVLTGGLGIVLFGLTTTTGWLPFHAGTMALAYSVGLVLHTGIAAAISRR